LETLDHTGKHQNTLAVLTDREEIIALIEQQKGSAAEILEKIENAVPAEAIVTEAEIGSEQVVLKGFAPDYSKAAEVLSRLQEDSHFTGSGNYFPCCYNEELQWGWSLNWCVEGGRKGNIEQTGEIFADSPFPDHSGVCLLSNLTQSDSAQY